VIYCRDRISANTIFAKLQIRLDKIGLQMHPDISGCLDPARFSGRPEVAKARTLFYTLIEKAKAANLDPSVYMSYFLYNEPWAVEKITGVLSIVNLHKRQEFNDSRIEVLTEERL